MTNAEIADICRAVGASLALGIAVLFVVLDPGKRDTLRRTRERVLFARAERLTGGGEATWRLTVSDDPTWECWYGGTWDGLRAMASKWGFDEVQRIHSGWEPRP